MEKKFVAALGVSGVVIIGGAFFVGAQFAAAEPTTQFPTPFIIGATPVSGLSFSAAHARVAGAVMKILHTGMTISIAGGGVGTVPLVVKGEPVFPISVSDTMDAARAVVGRGMASRAAAWVASLVGKEEPYHVPLMVSHTARTDVLLADAVHALNVPFQKSVNAQFAWSEEGGALQATVVPSTDGRGLDTASVESAMMDALSRGETSITVAPTQQRAVITTAAAQDLLPGVLRALFNRSVGLTLTIQKIKIPVDRLTAVSLVQPLENGDVGIDPELLKQKLGARLAPFEQPGSNAVFEREGNRVTKFVPDTKGVAINWNATAQDIFAALHTTASTDVAVTTVETDPEVTLASLNDLGIKELVGTGSSDASGSTKNRLHNITTGMQKINGALIAPGETFSLIGAIGKIDDTTGFTKELVIKDNKTQPDFGGGLCQIGTTTFRAAMGAGFPIVERRNHSYQVHYYFENGVSGTDATIYSPKPDLRFTNDTGHWVMLQTHISGVKLTFEFWGTRDGRTATRTIPKILTTTPAPPKKIIESTDVPVGKTKCTEKAHVGASTVFTYTVTYADGTVKTEDFHSFYKPWAEVCAVGVAATSTPHGGTPLAGAPGAPPLTLSPDAAGAAGN